MSTRLLFFLAAFVSFLLGLLSAAYAAVALMIDTTRYTPDEMALVFMLFGALAILYLIGFALSAVAAVRPALLPTWLKASHVVSAASVLGFFSVVPLAVAWGFAGNAAAVALVAVIGGVLPVGIYLVCERLSLLSPRSVEDRSLSEG